MRGPSIRPTVLITGSSGFLGQAIARGLMKDYRIVGLDVAPPKRPLDGVETIEIDLTSDESVAGAIGTVRERSGGSVASVIHLAAYYDTTGEPNPKYEAVTVQGTRRLLNALKSIETRQFVFSSTLLVHAPSPEKGTRINEDSPLDPPWAYPQSKADTEALIAGERGGIKTMILRLAGVYDEDCRAAFIAQQIARIFEQLPTAYLFAGDIGSGQPYLHVDDLVDAVVRTVDRRWRPTTTGRSAGAIRRRPSPSAFRSWRSLSSACSSRAISPPTRWAISTAYGFVLRARRRAGRQRQRGGGDVLGLEGLSDRGRGARRLGLRAGHPRRRDRRPAARSARFASSRRPSPWC